MLRSEMAPTIPHMLAHLFTFSLLHFLHRPLPALDGGLPRARHGQLSGRRILCDGAAGADRGPFAHGDWRYELRIRADERIVLNDGLVLVGAVVIAGDGASADVDVAADGRVA